VKIFKIEIKLFAMIILAAITGCYWIKWLYDFHCYCCSYACCQKL